MAVAGLLGGVRGDSAGVVLAVASVVGIGVVMLVADFCYGGGFLWRRVAVGFFWRHLFDVGGYDGGDDDAFFFASVITIRQMAKKRQSTIATTIGKKPHGSFAKHQTKQCGSLAKLGSWFGFGLGLRLSCGLGGVQFAAAAGFQQMAQLAAQ